jgi:hypothetical protein
MSTTIFSGQLTSAGFSRVSLTDIKAHIDGLYQAAYGADADLDAKSSDGQISGGLSEMFDDTNSMAEDVITGLTNPNAATGQTLSGQMVLTGCPRNAASRSTAPCTFTGTNGTAITPDDVVQSTEDDSLWSPLATYTISGTTVAGTLQAHDYGSPASGRVPAGTLTIIQTPKTGWTSVTNSIGVAGFNVERDPNARVRRRQSVAIASQGMTDGLQAALKTISHVLDAVCWENDKGNAVTIGESGNVINANSLRVFARVDVGSSADPAQTTSSADPIANMIFALKGHGCGTQGAKVKYPLNRLGAPREIRYDLAVALAVQIKVKVAKRYNWPEDGSRRITSAITSWATGTNATTGKANLQISGDDRGSLSWTDVLSSFLHDVPGFDFTSLQFSTDSGSTWTTDRTSLSIPFGSFAEIAGVTVEAT